MPLVGLDVDKTHIGRHGVQGMHDLFVVGGWIVPIAAKGNNAEACFRVPEGARQRAAMIRRQVEIIHRPGDVEIGIGVEPIHKAGALMAQIALDLEVRSEAIGDLVAILQIPIELLEQGAFRHVGDVGSHARNREPFSGPRVMVVIGSPVPVRVSLNGLATDLVKGDVLGRMAGGGGDGDGAKNTFRIGACPLQGLHPAHGAPGDTEQALNAQFVQQHGLRADHVGDGDDGKIETVGFAGFWVLGGGAGASLTAANDIGADHKKLVRVDGAARADHQWPPAILAGGWMGVCRVLIQGQGVAYQDNI